MIVHAFIENQGDAWRYTLNELDGELANQSDLDTHATSRYAEAAALLGRRIAELHLALAQNTWRSDVRAGTLYRGLLAIVV